MRDQLARLGRGAWKASLLYVALVVVTTVALTVAELDRFDHGKYTDTFPALGLALLLTLPTSLIILTVYPVIQCEPRHVDPDICAGWLLGQSALVMAAGLLQGLVLLLVIGMGHMARTRVRGQDHGGR